MIIRTEKEGKELNWDFSMKQGAREAKRGF